MTDRFSRCKSSVIFAGVQNFAYFCNVKRAVVILLVSCVIWNINAQFRYEAEWQDIVADIYNFLTEKGETDFEELQSTLNDIAANPVNINTASADDLRQLRFLSDRQIDAILLYVYHHKMENLSELRLIPELKDYEVRNLLPFVYAGEKDKDEPIYWREVFSKAKHELLARADGRYLEEPQRDKQKDPVYTQFRYKFSSNNLLQAGITLRRPTGTGAEGLMYGGYVKGKAG